VRSAPCTWRRARVSWLSLKIKIDGLSVIWLQNHWDGLSVNWLQNYWGSFLRFGLKTGGDSFPSVWTSKPIATVCKWFSLKTTRTVFTSLASKPVVTVSGGLISKSATTVSTGLASKSAAMIFGGLISKPATTVSIGLASKPTATVSDGLTSKPVVTVFRLVPQNRQLQFGNLGLKIAAMFSWFGPQNQEGFDLLIAPQN
jgi:hypothetical protein